MSKEELLKYLIAEIDLIMHDKDYRFENANGTRYSRESCRDLTNEEVFEELRTELRQFVDLEAKLAESEEDKKALICDYESRITKEQELMSWLEHNNEELKQQLAEKDEQLTNGCDKCLGEHHDLTEKVLELSKQLAEKDHTIETLIEDSGASKEFLKKQLAVKEKEIKTMQESSDKNIDYLIEFASLIEDQKDCNRMLKALERVRTGKKYIVDKEHQDKISFALEQLEKVKEYWLKHEDVSYYIDNQIKQLKEGK